MILADLTFMELSFDEIYSMWKEFSDDIGIEWTKKAYGDYWIRKPVEKERVWIFFYEGKRVGWVSLRSDPIEPIVWQASGVWSEYQQSGIAPLMLKWCVKKSFELYPEAKAMFWAVSKYNPKFIEWNRQMLKNEWSIEAGEINFPKPGFIYFGVVKRIK